MTYNVDLPRRLSLSLSLSTRSVRLRLVLLPILVEYTNISLIVHLDPQRMRKNIKENLTLNMRYKNDKNIKFVITRFVFFKLKMHQNLFSAPDPAGEAYDAPPDP